MKINPLIFSIGLLWNTACSPGGANRIQALQTEDSTVNSRSEVLIARDSDYIELAFKYQLDKSYQSRVILSATDNIKIIAWDYNRNENKIYYDTVKIEPEVASKIEKIVKDIFIDETDSIYVSMSPTDIFTSGEPPILSVRIHRQACPPNWQEKRFEIHLGKIHDNYQYEFTPTMKYLSDFMREGTYGVSFY